jgi:hypothetical protein
MAGAKDGPALKIANLRDATWTSRTPGVARVTGHKSMTGAYQSFRVRAEVNGVPQDLNFDFWNRGASRDVFKADLPDGRSICLKAVVDRESYKETITRENSCSESAELGPLVNKLLWDGKVMCSDWEGTWTVLAIVTITGTVDCEAYMQLPDLTNGYVQDHLRATPDRRRSARLGTA